MGEKEQKNLIEEMSVPPPSQSVLDEMSRNTQSVLTRNKMLKQQIINGQQNRFNLNNNQYPMQYVAAPIIYQNYINKNYQYQSLPNISRYHSVQTPPTVYPNNTCLYQIINGEQRSNMNMNQYRTFQQS